jgi:tetratricopeptide (TPR) repeat protein
MLRLAAVGDEALAPLQRCAESSNPELSWRARAAIAMIRWSIAPAASAELVPLVADYESLQWMDRQMRLREVSAAGRKLAIPTLIAALRIEKDDRVRRTIVRILAGRNLWPEGLAALREIEVPGVDLGSLLDPRVMISIGNAFLRAGDYDRALREYERAIALLPNEPVVLYNIGCIYALRGEADKAFDHLRRSIQAGYDDEEWLKRDPDLKGLHEDPRFAELIESIRQLKATGLPSGALNPEEALPVAPPDEAPPEQPPAEP